MSDRFWERVASYRGKPMELHGRLISSLDREDLEALCLILHGAWRELSDELITVTTRIRAADCAADLAALEAVQ